jgi:hypothetical protein
LKYGPFDLIVDDGGHTTEMIMTSLRVLWGCMNHNGVYVIEDLHSMSMWKDMPGMLVEGKDAYEHLAVLSRNMVTYFREKSGTMMRRKQWMDPFSKHISEMATYDSLVFLHYTDSVDILTQLKMGEKWISDQY